MIVTKVKKKKKQKEMRKRTTLETKALIQKWEIKIKRAESLRAE